MAYNTGFRRKKCFFCEMGIEYIDYKDIETIEKFINRLGKIIPSRISGVCSYHQRKLAVAVKRARIMALLPFKKD